MLFTECHCPTTFFFCYNVFKSNWCIFVLSLHLHSFTTVSQSHQCVDPAAKWLKRRFQKLQKVSLEYFQVHFTLKKEWANCFYAHIFILVQYSIILWHSTVSDVVPLPQIKCSMNECIFHRRTYSNLFLSTERDMLPHPLKFLEQPWRWCIRTFFKQKSPHLHNFIFSIPNFTTLTLRCFYCMWRY